MLLIVNVRPSTDSIIILDPIANVTLMGNNWVKNGELFDTTINCKGSPPYRFCVDYIDGKYNVTGNETCEHWTTIESCEVGILRYFPIQEICNILIVIENDVSKTINKFSIQIYKGEFNIKDI